MTYSLRRFAFFPRLRSNGASELNQTSASACASITAGAAWEPRSRITLERSVAPSRCASILSRKPGISRSNSTMATAAITDSIDGAGISARGSVSDWLIQQACQDVAERKLTSEAIGITRGSTVRGPMAKVGRPRPNGFQTGALKGHQPTPFRGMIQRSSRQLIGAIVTAGSASVVCALICVAFGLFGWACVSILAGYAFIGALIVREATKG